LSYDEDSFERKLVQVQALLDEEKDLKAQVKKDAVALHLRTKETIEHLRDDQAFALLEDKWITPLMGALHRIPDTIIAELVSRVRSLSDKYGVTYAEVAEEIAETKTARSGLIDGLTGNEFDMKGLGEFQKLLRGGK
jgi:type I restriction enzyme M protein